MITTEINLSKEILKLKKELNAVILAHYYQVPEIQDIADFVGDSLELSKQAAKTNADVIVFAGVHFMAETAKILNPTKKVILPDLEAGCSLSDSCPAPLFKKFREEHPEYLAVTYINSSAAVKALSDIICTSSNAEKIIRSIPENQKILFSPDRNLGRYLMEKTGREMLLWDGTCMVHEQFVQSKLEKIKEENPDALIIAHPECEEKVLDISDFIGSTSQLLRFVKETNHNKFIVATETGIIHQMQKACPDKIFIPAPPEDSTCACNECPHMKKNTLEKLYQCMVNLEPEIVLPDELIEKAYIPIKRMLDLS
ncbi:MAG: quinolinate synthase NadA [Ignavibacteria bacterium]|jgi:quinolinate synthase|nr:quinolinate synthase NadA [Ignavibacteria bacterium]MDH7528319.1 quinolinate synthase NadA [Ignavibacteria bacterium]